MLIVWWRTSSNKYVSYSLAESFPFDSTSRTADGMGNCDGGRCVADCSLSALCGRWCVASGCGPRRGGGISTNEAAGLALGVSSYIGCGVDPRTGFVPDVDSSGLLCHARRRGEQRAGDHAARSGAIAAILSDGEVRQDAPYSFGENCFGSHQAQDQVAIAAKVEKVPRMYQHILLP